MTAQEAFEKNKHMDKLFSDSSIMPDSFLRTVILDLWEAIKNSLQKGEGMDDGYKELFKILTNKTSRKERKMETVKVSEILDLVKKIHKDAQTTIHFLEGRILIGEINHPESPVEKKPRKKRTPKVKIVEPGMIIANILDSSLPGAVKVKRKRRMKKEMALNATAGHIKMNLEKEYQAERHEPLNLPDADAGSTFYGKPKKERKKREKKVPTVE